MQRVVKGTLQIPRMQRVAKVTLQIRQMFSRTQRMPREASKTWRVLKEMPQMLRVLKEMPRMQVEDSNNAHGINGLVLLLLQVFLRHCTIRAHSRHGESGGHSYQGVAPYCGPKVRGTDVLLEG